MRCARIITAFILTSALVCCLCIPLSAAALEEKIIIDCCEASYGKQYFKMYYPQVNRDNYAFPQIKNPYDGDVENPPTLSAITLLGYTNTGIDWKEGYIYTFNFTVACALIEDNVIPTISLGIASLTNDGSAISEYYSIGDITYTYNKTGNSTNGYTYTYSITSVVKVDSDFGIGPIADYHNTYVALNIAGIFQHSSANVTVLANRMKAIKSIGEDAYYQASLDAIEGLPQSEYDYIYNSMPDETGEVETIKGQFIEVLAVFNPDLEALAQALTTDVARPCVFLPSVVIPFMDIEVWDNQIFYVDSYLNKMNPNIMSALESMLFFVRSVALFTFITVGLYKMIRMEWWT